mmetsp:Transcript_28275/g.28563  ORF Transcript_28275/g.28563 Transcript_28275/m.28563 type:complete len:354 (+) Transcript_28275:155-1216(+)
MISYKLLSCVNKKLYNIAICQYTNKRYQQNLPLLLTVQKRSLSSNDHPPEKDSKHGSRNIPPNTAAAIASATKHYTSEFNRAYGDVEKVLMNRIHESNKRRFRIILLSITIALFWIVVIFGRNIRQKLTDETATLARETLENESLKVQTKELATAVVQTILNDRDVMRHAAEFLRDASGAAETQAALLSLTLHVLQHPQSVAELALLVKKVLPILTSDQDTVDQLASLLARALQDPGVQIEVSRLVQSLGRDPEVLRVLTDAVILIIKQPEVQQATVSVLSSSSLSVLEDSEVIDQARGFVGEVVGDDRLQREGGQAIFKSVSHAVMPSLLRVTGIAIISASIAVLHVMLSPF